MMKLNLKNFIDNTNNETLYTESLYTSSYEKVNVVKRFSIVLYIKH